MYDWDILGNYKQEEDLLAQILKTRKLIESTELETFLNPPSINYWLKKLTNEFLVSLKSGKALILDHIKNNLPIVIHGDYDVDGICATSILYKTISKQLNYSKVYNLIPNRFVHGYGLSNDSIDEALKLVNSNEQVLFITVDSGITSVNEANYIKQLGHKLIITDHHQKPEVLPDAQVILWNDKIVGAVISWVLSTALGLKDKHMLALAAIATVSDLQPLLNFNRSIVKKGLEILNTDPPLGIKKLLELNTKGDKPISTYELGWVIGPRLNASGRLVDASESLKLLIEENDSKAEKYASELNKINLDRQTKTTEMFDIATEFEEAELPKVIVTQNENYHEGIIGLVASKLAQQYNRPAIVISTSEEVAKGSVRSINGINIIEILRIFGDMFLSLGGHPMAAGFSIENEKIEDLKNALEAYFDENFNDSDFKKVLSIEMQIPPSLISIQTINQLKALEPYGLGNEKPVFCTKNLGVSKIDLIGKESTHLLLKLFDGENFLKAIFFNKSDLAENLKIGDMVDIAYYLQENIFNGVTYVDLILKDLKHSK